MFGNYRTLTYIVLVIILGFFVIRPQWTVVQTLRNGITEYSEVLANLSTYNEQITALLRRRDALGADETARLSQFIGVNGVNTAQIVYNLEQEIFKNQLALVSVHPFEIQRGSGVVNVGTVGMADFVTQDIELTVSGTYESFKNFVQTIETTLEPYQITYMKFSNEDESSVMSFTVRVRVAAISL